MSLEENALTLSQAKTLACAWQNFIKTWKTLSGDPLPEVDQVKAFFVPIGDLVNLVTLAKNNPDITGVRAYLGKGVLLAEPSEEAPIKLLFVPVINSTDTDPGTDHIVPVGEDKVSIYDLTSPCPTFCDGASPLHDACI